MTNNLPQSLDFLLDKNWMTDFFNKNSKEIFGSESKIEIIEIERSKSFAPESYAMFYKIMVDRKSMIIRASGSLLEDRFYPYHCMEFIFQNGLSDGDIQAPKPFHFFKEYNLMLYQDVPGQMLKDYISSQDENLEEMVLNSGKALNKFHQIPKPEFKVHQKKWHLDQQKIFQYAPQIKNMIDEFLDRSLKMTENRDDHLCHGDYQPKNIIISDVTYIIDFGSTSLAAKELDVACFISQLEIMLQRYGDPGQTEILKKSFFEGYGEFENELFMAYYFLYQLDIMQALIVIYEQDPNANKDEVQASINFWADIINKTATNN